jgi:hypothetical protein
MRFGLSSTGVAVIANLRGLPRAPGSTPEKRRAKPGTHEGPYLIAPYYFYYGHRYAAQAVELFPESERAKERRRLFELALKTRNKDGTWNDRVFPRARAYGTAMIVLSLLSDKIPAPPPLTGK